MSMWHKAVVDLRLKLMHQDYDGVRQKFSELQFHEEDYKRLMEEIKLGSEELRAFLQTVHENCRNLMEQGEWDKLEEGLIHADALANSAQKHFKRVIGELVDLK